MVDKTIKRTLKKIFLEILQLCLNALFLEREKENNLHQKNHQQVGTVKICADFSGQQVLSFN